MKTITIETAKHGLVTAFHAIDEAGNERLIPVGAASLAAWRKDQTLLPPWLTPSDLAVPEMHGTYVAAARG